MVCFTKEIHSWNSSGLIVFHFTLLTNLPTLDSWKESNPRVEPLRSTNRIPVRQARSDTRGRPPCGFGMEAGRSGWIIPHSLSGTSVAAIRRFPDQRNIPDVKIVQEEVLLQALRLLTPYTREV